MDKIIFAYNADSGILNGIRDLLHKNFSPKTYACRLCAITYDNFGTNREWNEFAQTLKTPLEFLHRDELKKQYGVGDVPLPAAFVQRKDTGLQLWIDADEINRCQSLGDLKELILDKLG